MVFTLFLLLENVSVCCNLDSKSGLTTYSDTLLTFIQQLYTEYPMKEIVQHVPFQYSEDPELLFLVLFSYDYFNYTHNLLCKIMTKQDIMQCQTELITVLKKNNV